MGYTYKMYYEALKRREIRTHNTTWMDLEDKTLSETSQSQTDEFCVTLST